MNNNLKAILKKFYIYVNRSFFSLFYQKAHLQGKFFDTQLIGWKWARSGLLWQKFLGNNKQISWPVGKDVHVVGNKIQFDQDDLNNFQSFGIYFQAIDASITIGKGTYIAPNVGLITSNHSVSDPAIHMPGKNIVLGQKCWVGMNSVILPGVVLGDHTVVGAGAVVTKSFTDGWCVLAGTPAKVIKSIPKDEAH